MKRLFTILFVLLVVMNSFAQEKFALVIGNGNYTSFGSLANAVNDANDMTVTLQNLGFKVDKVLDGNRAQMVEAISRLKNRLSVSKSSYGFLFYAGHGIQFNGANYLIPAKADIPNANYLGDTAISVQTMLAELNDAGNELNIIVLDACRDFPAVWSRSMNRGLSVVTNQPADSIIVYATSAGSTAADGVGRNGLFTGQLLKNLVIPGLEVSEVFRRTGADVSQISKKQQIPAVYNQFFGIAYLGQLPIKSTEVVPIDSRQMASIPTELEYEEIVFDGNRYVRFDIGMTWTDAKNYCESLGGHLVTITSQNEQEVVYNLIKDGTKDQYWLGANRNKNWITGEKWIYQNWLEGQPDNHLGNESYVQMFRLPNPYDKGRKVYAGKWNDAPHNNTIKGEEKFFSLDHIGFICEWEK